MQFSDSDDVQSGPAAIGGLMPPDLHDTHHLWLKAFLLGVWVVSSFGAVFFARDLQAWVQGWQLGYWMAAQGAVLMFMLITLGYCVVMDYFERPSQSRSGVQAAARTAHADSSSPP